MTIKIYKNVQSGSDIANRDSSLHHYTLSSHKIQEETWVSLLNGGYDFRDGGAIKTSPFQEDVIGKPWINYVYVTRRIEKNKDIIQDVYKELYSEFFTLIQDILTCNHTDTQFGSELTKDYKNFRVTSDLYIEDVSLDIDTGDVVSLIKQIDYSFEHWTDVEGKYPKSRSIVFVMDISIT